MLPLLILLAAAEGRPLFYWGARPPVVTAEASPSAGAAEASVTEVHAALEPKGLVVRFSFDRPARDAMRLPDGTPVSGRLRAVLYLDTDDERQTGLDQGPLDPRTGSEGRLEVGVVSVGEDPEEKRAASALLTVTLSSLLRDGRRKTVWRADAEGNPSEVSAHGEWVEVRIPASALEPRAPLRLVLAEGNRAFEGRLPR
jgi:hypothetical protein